MDYRGLSSSAWPAARETNPAESNRAVEATPLIRPSLLHDSGLRGSHLEIHRPISPRDDRDTGSTSGTGWFCRSPHLSSRAVPRSRLFLNEDSTSLATPFPLGTQTPTPLQCPVLRTPPAGPTAGSGASLPTVSRPGSDRTSWGGDCCTVVEDHSEKFLDASYFQPSIPWRHSLIRCRHTLAKLVLHRGYDPPQGSRRQAPKNGSSL